MPAPSPTAHRVTATSTSPHAGFAIGFERMVAWLVGAERVRETTFVPREPDRLTS